MPDNSGSTSSTEKIKDDDESDRKTLQYWPIGYSGLISGYWKIMNMSKQVEE